jgi:hypothetical protein
MAMNLPQVCQIQFFEPITWRAVMQEEVTSFWEWQQHYSDEKRCLQALIKRRWPDGFVCGCSIPCFGIWLIAIK